ncbi:MAG: TetR/AcrR family transcriptional regulator [Isosphaeraceae bacterium]|nr:TetR/AcrR family transcriptional regulator [Isosphaeraceae bacterium]
MRYPADHKQKTRQRILDAAAVVFRREGLQAGSVDKVMGEAGLTAGGFYTHFTSKEALFAEMLTEALRQGRVIFGKEDEGLTGSERIRAIVGKYLSPAHRRMIDRGCPMPPLLPELPRAGEPARRAFEEALGAIVAALEPHLEEDGGATRSDRALALVALLVGGMTLSRAVADDALANRILAACRDQIDASLGAKSD